jgi:DNA-binding beta-propeller fold protein YncE
VGNWSSSNVSAYTITATTGALASIAGSPYPVGAGPSALAVDPSGKFLYVANYWTDDITGFSVDMVSGDLVELNLSPFEEPLGSHPAAIAVVRIAQGVTP